MNYETVPRDLNETVRILAIVNENVQEFYQIVVYNFQVMWCNFHMYIHTYISPHG